MQHFIRSALVPVFISIACSRAQPTHQVQASVCVPDRAITVLGPTRFLPSLLDGVDHFAVTFSPNLERLYVTRGLIDGGGVFTSTMHNGIWSELQQFHPLSGEYNDNDFVVPPGGNIGFFMSKRPIEPGGPLQSEQDLWMMRQTGGQWTPEHLGTRVNSVARDGYPSITAGGTLYFFSEREGGIGSGDIYRSRLDGGTYGEPDNLGPAVNTDDWDGLPYVAPDESFLIFFSTRPGGYGGGDLYVAYNTGGEWSNAQNLGALVNSPLSDLTPYVSPDGECLFFSRPDGPDNRRRVYGMPTSQTPIRIDRQAFKRASESQ